MIRLRLSSAAQNDLVDIRLYGNSQFGREVADAYLRGLNSAFARLRAFPMVAPDAPDLGPDIRCLVHRRHRIFYQIDGDTLLIVRIIHHARDLGTVFRGRRP